MAQPAQDFEWGTRFSPRPQISHVVFDFDGTLSWLRHGWPELMAGLFLKHVALKREQASVIQIIHDLLLHDILSLNGKSSIFQMERCAQRVQEHGGPHLNPELMLLEYQAALQAIIGERKEKVRTGAAKADEFVVHGARRILESLHGRGLHLIILSGTAEPQVKEEAQLLEIAQFFGPHIYGGTTNVQQSSKKAVLERLLREENISGEQLLSFGDGPVEILLTKEAGGLAVGVASDEERNGSGQMNVQKLRLLREAGADLLVPDYRGPDELLTSILGS